MGGKIPQAAVVLRRLIDHGPESPPPDNPLPPPWDDIYRAVRAAGASSRARHNAFHRAVADLPDRLRITLQVEDALKPPSVGIQHPAPDSSNRFIPASVALMPRVPPQSLIQDFISLPGLNLVVGESGSKKTFVVLDLAVSLALGLPWLDRPSKQANVLWIDEESGQVRLLNRLAQVMRAHNAPSDLPFRLSSLSGFDLRDPKDVQTLTDQALKFTASLIVIDPLVGVIPGADENSVFHLVPVFQSLRTLAARVNSAVIIIHHTNKSGVYRGSTHLRGAVDLMLMTYSRNHTPFIEFKSIKTRDIAPLHFAAQIHFDPPHSATERVWLSPANLSQALRAIHSEQPFSQAAQHVLDYLTGRGPSKTQNITQSAQNCTPQQVRSAIFMLIEIGLIERKDTGGRGKTATYSLVD